MGVTIVVGSTAGYTWLFRAIERQGRPVGRLWLFVLSRPYFWFGLAMIATALGTAAFAACFSITFALAVAGATGHPLGVPAVPGISAVRDTMSGKRAAARLKLDWAREHLTKLHLEIASFAERQVQHVGIDVSADRRTYLVYISMLRRRTPPSPLIVGDVLFNLRAALDHVIYELHETANGGPLPPDKRRMPEFPIWDDRRKYRRNGRKRVAALPARAQALVQSFQPYHRSARDSTPGHLGLLNDLNVIDKHRTLHIVTEQVAVYPVDNVPGRVVEVFPSPIHKGALIARWTFDEPQTEQMYVDTRSTVRVFIGEGSMQYLILYGLADTVGASFGRLSRTSKRVATLRRQDLLKAAVAALHPGLPARPRPLAPER